jgi:cytochrome c biogenesis protein CcdA
MAGWLLILGLTQIIAQLFSRLNEVIYVFQFLLGIALILLGYYFNKFANQSTTNKRPKSLKPIHTFWLGFAIAFAEAPTALLYLVAIEQIVRANLQVSEIFGALTLYNFVFVFPLIVLLGIYFFFRKNAVSVLDRIHRSIARWFPKIMRVVLIIFGFLLIVDSVIYLFGYSIF